MSSHLTKKTAASVAVTGLHLSLNTLLEEVEDHIENLPSLSKDDLYKLLISLNRFDTLQYRLRGALACEMKRRAEVQAAQSGNATVVVDVVKLAPVFNVQPDTLRSDIKIHEHYFAAPDEAIKTASSELPRFCFRAALVVPKEEAREMIIREVQRRREGVGCKTEEQFRDTYLRKGEPADVASATGADKSENEVIEVKTLQISISMEEYQAALYLKRTLRLATIDDAIAQALGNYASARKRLAQEQLQ